VIAVSDTSPLCYLILIAKIDLLPKLFGQISVPRAVVDELRHDDAPELV
jgi:predicted nucleic acid-binding protein